MDVIRWLNTGRVSVIIAVLALLVAGVTWLTTRHAVRQARRQATAAEEQAKATAEQADAAKQAAVAAEQQAQAAREQVYVAEVAVAVAREQARMAQEQVGLGIRQLEHAERVRTEQMRAFVIADIEADTSQPELVILTVRNHGQSVARHVRVEFNPPLVSEPGRAEIRDWAVSTLAPGARLARGITSGRSFFNSGIQRLRQRVTVTATDANGPLEALTYDIDLAAPGTVASGAKTTHHVWQQLRKIADELEKIAENTRGGEDDVAPPDED